MRVFEAENMLTAMMPYETPIIPVAADYKMVGLAERAKFSYPIESTLSSSGYGLFPDSLYACGALVFVGRKNSDSKYERFNLKKSIRLLKTVCEHEDIRHIAVQPFGGAQWPTIQEMLINGLGPEFNINIYRRKQQCQ